MVREKAGSHERTIHRTNKLPKRDEKCAGRGRFHEFSSLWGRKCYQCFNDNSSFISTLQLAVPKLQDAKLTIDTFATKLSQKQKALGHAVISSSSSGLLRLLLVFIGLLSSTVKLYLPGAEGV